MEEREKKQTHTYTCILEEQIFLRHDHSTVGVWQMTLSQYFNPILSPLCHVLLLTSCSTWADCQLRREWTISQLFAQRRQINHMVAVTFPSPHAQLQATNRWRVCFSFWLTSGWSSDCGLWCVSEGDRRLNISSTVCDVPVGFDPGFYLPISPCSRLWLIRVVGYPCMQTCTHTHTDICTAIPARKFLTITITTKCPTWL